MMMIKKSKTMKSAIFYGSTIKLTNAHKAVHGSKQPHYFVRMDTIDGGCEHALSKATPRKDEIVLNTVEFK